MAGRGCTPTQVAKAGARIKDLIAERMGLRSRPGCQAWWAVVVAGGQVSERRGVGQGLVRPELVALVRDRWGH